MRRYNYYDYYKHDYFEDIFYESIHDIFTKKVIECIEDNECNLKYDKEIQKESLEDILPIYDIYNSVYDVYINALNRDNMDYFCHRCANFNHESDDKCCIFYNDDFATKNRLFDRRRRQHL